MEAEADADAVVVVEPEVDDGAESDADRDRESDIEPEADVDVDVDVDVVRGRFARGTVEVDPADRWPSSALSSSPRRRLEPDKPRYTRILSHRAIPLTRELLALFR